MRRTEIGVVLAEGTKGNWKSIGRLVAALVAVAGFVVVGELQRRRTCLCASLGTSCAGYWGRTVLGGARTALA